MITIKIPNLEVNVNQTEFGWTYSLYVNGEYEGTYISKSDLEFRIVLIQTTAINEVLEK